MELNPFLLTHGSISSPAGRKTQICSLAWKVHSLCPGTYAQNSQYSCDKVSDLVLNFFRQRQKLDQKSCFLGRFWPLSNHFENCISKESVNYHHILRDESCIKSLKRAKWERMALSSALVGLETKMLTGVEIKTEKYNLQHPRKSICKDHSVSDTEALPVLEQQQSEGAEHRHLGG